MIRSFIYIYIFENINILQLFLRKVVVGEKSKTERRFVWREKCFCRKKYKKREEEKGYIYFIKMC